MDGGMAAGFGDIVTGTQPLAGGYWGGNQGRVTSDEFRSLCYPANIVGPLRTAGTLYFNGQDQTGGGRYWDTNPLGTLKAYGNYPGDLGSLMCIGGGKHVVNNGSFPYSGAYETAGTWSHLQNAGQQAASFQAGQTITDQQGSGNGVLLPQLTTAVGAVTYFAWNTGTTTPNPTIDYQSGSAFRTDGGTLNCAVQISYFSKLYADSGATIGTRIGFQFTDFSDTGTVSHQAGLNIPVLAGGATSNLGINNSAPTAFGHTGSQALTASSQIVASATHVLLTATAAISLTGTTPTISAAAPYVPQDGQVLYLVVAGTAGHTITFTSQGTLAGSALSLGAATRVVNRGGCLSLIYNSTLAEWVETGFNPGNFGT